jgi:hypothetical protein
MCVFKRLMHFDVALIHVVQFLYMRKKVYILSGMHETLFCFNIVA